MFLILKHNFCFVVNLTEQLDVSPCIKHGYIPVAELTDRNHVGSMTDNMTSGVDVPMTRSVANASLRCRLHFSRAIAIMKP